MVRVNGRIPCTMQSEAERREPASSEKQPASQQVRSPEEPRARTAASTRFTATADSFGWANSGAPTYAARRPGRGTGEALPGQ